MGTLARLLVGLVVVGGLALAGPAAAQGLPGGGTPQGGFPCPPVVITFNVDFSTVPPTVTYSIWFRGVCLP